MKRLYFSRFKTLILMMLIVTTMLFSYNTQKANAIAGEEVLIIGGVAVTVGATAALIGYTLQSGGVKLKSSNVSDNQGMAYIADKLIRGGQAAHYLSVQVDSANKKFLTWTSDGFNWFKDTISDLIGQGGVTTTLDSNQNISISSETSFSSYTDSNKPLFVTPSITISGGGKLTGMVDNQSFTYSNIDKTSHTVAYGLSFVNGLGHLVRFVDGSLESSWYLDNVTNSFVRKVTYQAYQGSVYYPLSDNFDSFSTQKSETAVQEVVEVTDPSTGEKKNENRPKIGVPIIPGKDTTTNPDGTTQTIEIPDPSNPPVTDGESDWDSTSAPISINYPSPNNDPKTDPTDNPKTDPTTQPDTNVPKDDVPKLDFKPLMIATMKFPFCIPWDLWDSYKIFEGNSEPFKYEFKQVDVNFGFIGCGSVTVVPNFVLSFEDYPQVDTAVKVFKFIELILFIVFLIVKTRTLIRG